MNKLEQLIFNDGERLVPYVSHNDAELVRHRSSYSFFHSVISADLLSHPICGEKVTVADLGFGSGYGCALLSSLPESEITGIDIGKECEIFARQYYPRSNVTYRIENLASYIPEAAPFDYVISRGVLEHVPDGLKLFRRIKFQRRLMIDVPYDEAPGNEHHVLTGITEEAFAGLSNCEFFYEDLDGRIFDAVGKPEKSNMLMVVLSSPELPAVSSLFEFPLQPVQDNELELLSAVKAKGVRHYFDSATDLLMAVENAVKETEVVADIGCGIMPINYFRPKLHFLIEPWREYADILTYRHAGDKSVVVIRAGALEALKQFGTNSVDSIFLLDVIEHLEKNDGREVIIESERVARQQIVVFTPFGFMPQHMDNGQSDGWGLHGSAMQEHLSGWEPEDFGEKWSFYICNNFHHINFKGELLDQPHGAFYAICNFDTKPHFCTENLSDIRRPLPSELELGLLRERYQALSAKHCALISSSPVAVALRLRRFLLRAKNWARHILQ